MVNVVFGRENVEPGKFVLQCRHYFTKVKKPEWFEDNFIKRAIKGIDGADVLFEEALRSKWGHGISTEMLSTGCKVVCCIYYDTDSRVFFATQMGDNCIPFYAELARTRDFTLCFEHYPDIPNWCFKEGLFVHDGVVLGEYDFDDVYSNWIGEQMREADRLGI